MEKKILELLSGVIHPDKGENIVKLGLVEGVKTVQKDDGTPAEISFKLSFTQHDPLAGAIKRTCTSTLEAAFPGVKVNIIEMVRERKDIKKTVNELGTEELQNIKHIIAVASGKGGVGKSTVAVNLAVALAKKGFKVGLADADVYGPSVPKMTATEGYQPAAMEGASGPSSFDLLLPVEKYGVKWMSIGYFADPGQALIWRGPMACNALKQMIMQVKWGELDYLLIDLPPGTGDIHITLVQSIPLSGAIIVTTPQEVALADVLKGVNMFTHKDVNVPILGIVENMSWFTPAELPENKYYIFGHDGGKKMADRLGLRLLGQIPLYMSLREGGDAGTPAALSDSPDAEAFYRLAETVSSSIGR